MILVPTRSLRCVDKLFFSDHRASTVGTSGKFFFSLPSLSFSLSIRFPLLFLSLFASLLIHRTYFSFCLFLHLVFSIFFYFSQFSFLSFSLLFLFLPFIFSISHLDYINPMVQKWGKLPPTFLQCHLSLIFFSLFS